ncbi:hypothetical protein KL940_000404 [Ogataea angusta]|uniref:Cell division control protein n=2 Tax=Pichia angusta TaxID=870730 RepID=A0ABQ7S3X5_PICAN|nr:hypothetical protein KL940_000404 [Ogataea angusta]KAG7859578.1 hypothetical protein KL939_002478 [Ogataea angusta]
MSNPMANITSSAIKRTLDPIEWEIQGKRIKLNQTSTTSLGLLSPPVTPEKHDRILNVQASSVSSLNTKLFGAAKSQPLSVYSRAKKLFLRSSAVDVDGFALTAREPEAHLLRQHIDQCLLKLESTSMYVSGPPGTGKTAQVNAILNSLIVGDIENADAKIYKVPVRINSKRINRRVRIAKINCMTVRKAEDIFDAIYSDLEGQFTRKKRTAQELKRFLADESKCDITLVVLDEMDNLMGNSQQVLFELFSWASDMSNDNPKLAIIGIANALDLTDRFLPRLKCNNISPRLIPFLPYTADQIKQVLTAKLCSLVDNKTTIPPLVHPAAIQLCAKKAAITTGDLRSAFDIMHRALELTESLQAQKLGSKELHSLTFENAPKVMIAQLARVCNSTVSSNFNSKLKDLNIQHKTVLCSLIKYEEVLKSQKSKTIASINSFYSYYASLQDVRKVIGALNRGEFLEVLSSLESDSFINICSTTNAKIHATSKIKGPISYGDSRLSSTVPKMDILKIIDDIGILKKILAGTENCI